ncbi:MAG: hypothetical protein AAFP84_07500 [Actinomycetota bacterium]
MVDRQRSEVYAAEFAAFDGTDLEDVQPLDEALALVVAVTTGEWWPGPEVRAIAMRSDAESSCARAVGDAVEVRIATPQATWATVAHELAHALAGVANGHGPMFRRALLDVIEVVTNGCIGGPTGPRRGRLHVDQLRATFAAADLAVSERSWPAPESGAPFAL